MESVSLYSEARNEYIKQMATWVVPQLVEFFRKEYDRIAVHDKRRVMVAFQHWCAEVPRWNQDVIDTHVNELLDNCKCDYIEDLMTAVFIAHTKMLTAIRVGGRQKKLQITLPKLDHFLHRVFVECARGFWKAPFLFSDEVSPIDRQKNVLQAEAMCVEALSGAVRSLLPIKNILRDNLEEEEEPVKYRKKKKYDSSSSDSDSEEEKPKSKHLALPIAAIAAIAPIDPLEVESIEPDIEEIDPNPVFTVPVPAVPDITPVPAPAVPEVIPVVPDITPVPVVPVAAVPEVVPVAPVPVVPEVAPATQGSVPSILKSKELASVQLIKDETIASPEHFVIDTEPTVKFSPYEMVYDESTPDISEMRYAPKMSIEEMPDKPPYEPVYFEEEGPLPKIQFGSGEVGLSGSDMEVVDEMGLSDADFEVL